MLRLKLLKWRQWGWLVPPKGRGIQITTIAPRRGAPPPRVSDEVLLARFIFGRASALLNQAEGYYSQPTEPADGQVRELERNVERTERAAGR